MLVITEKIALSDLLAALQSNNLKELRHLLGCKRDSYSQTHRPIAANHEEVNIVTCATISALIAGCLPLEISFLLRLLLSSTLFTSTITIAAMILSLFMANFFFHQAYQQLQQQCLQSQRQNEINHLKYRASQLLQDRYRQQLLTGGKEVMRFINLFTHYNMQRPQSLSEKNSATPAKISSILIAGLLFMSLLLTMAWMISTAMDFHINPSFASLVNNPLSTLILATAALALSTRFAYLHYRSRIALHEIQQEEEKLAQAVQISQWECQRLQQKTLMLAKIQDGFIFCEVEIPASAQNFTREKSTTPTSPLSLMSNNNETKTRHVKLEESTAQDASCEIDIADLANAFR